MSVIEELWSEKDQKALENFEQALASDKLSASLLAIERAAPQICRDVEERLDQLANEVRDAMDSTDLFTAASVLSHIIADECGLKGDTENYFRPENSFLSSVMTRKRGQPIAVSAVWIMVGQRAGINIHGVGLPQHFIVSLGDQAIFLDPFSSGSILSQADCRELVRELSDGSIRWNDRFLESVDNKALCERIIRNLCNSYSMTDDSVRLYQTVRFHASMRPELPSIHMLLGRLSEEFGDFNHARQSYEHVMTEFAETDEARVAEGRLKGLGDEPILKN